MKNKLYVINGKIYLSHINDEVHLYGLLHQLAFLAGRIKDEEDVFHVLDTAKRYGEIAEEKFQSWGIPGRYLVFGDPKDLKGLMDKELDEVEVVPEEEPKPKKYRDEYIIPGSGFRTRVYKTTRDGKRLTLEQECLQSGTLPSMAYGFKRCSLKHKIGPQEKFCNHYPPCRKVWAAGKRVVKFIGYDAGEGYRSDKVLLGDLADPKYSKWYPLMEWGWDRAACQQAIDDAGLPQPGKSSCFFCPSMRAEEIIRLRDHHPDLFRRAIALEDNARPNLKTVQGLGRNYSWKERFGKEFCTHGNC